MVERERPVDCDVLVCGMGPVGLLLANLLGARGLRVVAVDITEYEKLEGCVTCLSVPLRG